MKFNKPYLIPAGWVALAILLSCFSEIIVIYDGLGWDGFLHYNIINEFAAHVKQKDFDAYHFQRILPDYICRLLIPGHRNATPEEVVLFFRCFNLLCLALSGFLWLNILKHHGINSFKEIVFAFVLLFFNYGILKQPFFIPVNTDAAVLLIILLIWYCYQRDYFIPALLAMTAGFFTYTSIPFICGVILFSSGEIPFSNLIARMKRLSTLLALLTSIAFIACFYYFVFSPDGDTLYTQCAVITGGIFMGMLVRYMLLTGFGTSPWKKPYRTVSMLLLLTMLILLKDHYTVESTVMNTGHFLKNILRASGRILFAAPVSHFFYFGIAYLVFIYMLIRKHNTDDNPLNPALLLLLPLSITTESRQVFMLLPFLVVHVMRFLRQNVMISTGSITGFTIINLLMSKVWLQLNPYKFHRCLTTDEYPAQLYFMNHGPWVEKYTGIVLFCVTVTAAFILHFYITRNLHNEK